MTTYILTIQCPDAPGLVNRVTGALLEVGANITEAAQFTDPDTRIFAQRIVFDSPASLAEARAALDPVSEAVGGTFTLRPRDARRRVLIMASREEHCLLDLLFRHRNGELDIDIPLIISNHEERADLAHRYGIPFEHVPVTPETKTAAEKILLERVERLGIDFVVLARYMQILSPEVCHALEGRIINIHHSFLPAFIGASPYKQAYERGVKLIGATAHFVTSDLDQGPIIAQDIRPVNHSYTVKDMVRAGKEVEKSVLSKALRLVIEDRVIITGNKTVVFE